MLQGEFIERVLAGTLTDPDIRNYIKGQPKKDLPELLTFIHDKQGAIVAEGMFKDRNDYFNLQWREQFNKLYDVCTIVEEALGKNKKRATLPDVLDTEDFKCQFEMAKVGGLISQEGKWIGGQRKLAVFAKLMDVMPGVMKPHQHHPYYKPFEDYFGIHNLSQAFCNSNFSGKEEADEYQKYLYNS